MSNTIAASRSTIKQKTLATIIAVIAAVALPQLFHVVGIASGAGSVPGETFLPMHLPILAVGMIAGPAAGLIAGAASPLLSFAMSGMPAITMLPFMMVELAIYGASIGLLSRTKLPSVVMLLSAQLAGRAVRALAILSSVYLLGNTAVSVSVIYRSILVGLPGMLLQLTVLPLFWFWYQNRGAHHA